jgi:prolyl-tRNA synthetase
MAHVSLEDNEADFDEKKAIEVGNILKLGTKYSGAVGFEATGAEGKNLPVLMNCYGIGLTRLMGTIAETVHDEAGLVWPKAVAPFGAHLIGLEAKDQQESAKVKEMCQKIYEDLQKREIGVLYDDRPDKSAGEKFKDADLIGIPCRIVVSQKTLAQNSVEIKMRDEKEAKLAKIDQLPKFNF